LIFFQKKNFIIREKIYFFQKKNGRIAEKILFLRKKHPVFQKKREKCGKISGNAEKTQEMRKKQRIFFI
jgi:hypothetical protein